MGPFNNREIAIFIWLLLFIAFVLRKADVRKSLKTLVWTFCKIQILTVVSLMLLYVVLIVLVLRAVGVWEFTLFKDTVVWFCAALGMMMRFNISDKAENVFRKVLVDSVKVVILLEFLVNTYTFSLRPKYTSLTGFSSRSSRFLPVRPRCAKELIVAGISRCEESQSYDRRRYNSRIGLIFLLTYTFPWSARWS